MDSVRERITAFLRLPPPPAAPVVSVTDRKAEEGYTLSEHPASDGDQIEAFLMQPTHEKPRAAILALHQHNSQWGIGKSDR